MASQAQIIAAMIRTAKRAFELHKEGLSSLYFRDDYPEIYMYDEDFLKYFKTGTYDPEYHQDYNQLKHVKDGVSFYCLHRKEEGIPEGFVRAES